MVCRVRNSHCVILYETLRDVCQFSGETEAPGNYRSEGLGVCFDSSATSVPSE